ncbi:SBBP repeat-containing protein [Clostridium sp. YIM B02551]|uniref:DUF7948 domain-containing protein n=1 Tax=Clostridium sp. YIM B02551 TaxID=2910679 RepID=UPI001EEC14AB|nr:SBBP repeat-containing protein [Clostridium sp. YIM B02551]
MSLIEKKYTMFPLSFQVNEGQIDPEAKFMAKGSNYNLFFTPSQVVLSLRQRNDLNLNKAESVSTNEELEVSYVKMHFINAKGDLEIIGLEELPAKCNYFIGNDTSRWLTNISTYEKIKYKNIYQGIDIVYYGNQQQLEWDFIVQPNCDASQINIDFSGVEKITIDEQGNLILLIDSETLKLCKPLVYQEVAGKQNKVEADYVISEDQTVSFKLGQYDHSKSLVIDPILIWSTYYGDSGPDVGYAITTDSNNDVYITGYTQSNTFPTPTSLYPYKAGWDAFVAKIKGDGSGVIFFTYIGGSISKDPGSSGPHDYGYGIAVDSLKNIWVTGTTWCTDFPIFNPIQGANGGYCDCFISKISASGSSLLYSTYFGGGDYDQSFSIAVDILDSIYITGYTRSFGFPTTPGALKPVKGDISVDAFILKLSSTGTIIQYCTYLGGTQDDFGRGIGVDKNLNLYIAGDTKGNFPMFNALQPVYGGGLLDTFVTKLVPAGGAYNYVFSTYLGGAGEDNSRGIAIDNAGNVYAIGYTTGNFPIKNALQPSFGGGTYDAFIYKITTGGSLLVYSTYLGGTGDDLGYGIAVDANENAYITGSTTSSVGFPTTNAFQLTYAGNTDAFVAKINYIGILSYSSYLGGANYDIGYGIAVNIDGDVIIVGATYSNGQPPPGPGFPTKDPFQSINNGNGDIFITKLSEPIIPPTPPEPIEVKLSRGISFLE